MFLLIERNKKEESMGGKRDTRNIASLLELLRLSALPITRFINLKFILKLIGTASIIKKGYRYLILNLILLCDACITATN